MLRMIRPAPPANPSSTSAIPFLLPPCPNIVFRKSFLRVTTTSCFWNGNYLAQGISELKNSFRNKGVYLITSFADKCEYWEKRKCWLYTLVMLATHEARLETRPSGFEDQYLLYDAEALAEGTQWALGKGCSLIDNVFSARKSGNYVSFLELSPTIVTLYRKNKSNKKNHPRAFVIIIWRSLLLGMENPISFSSPVCCGIELNLPMLWCLNTRFLHFWFYWCFFVSLSTGELSGHKFILPIIIKG